MSEPESINGWTPPTLYDIRTDTIHIATQQDVDRLQACEQMLGQMVGGMRKLLHEFDCQRQALVLEQFSEDHLKPISEYLK